MLVKSSDFYKFFGDVPILAASVRVTKACNLRCKHCYAEGGRRLPNELETGEMLALIDQFFELGVTTVFYTGGEPFLRRDMARIINETSDKGISVYVSTNGTLVKADLLKELKRAKNLDLFQVSIDSTKPDVHDSIRGVAGTLVAAKNAVKLASQILKENICVATVMMRTNWRELPDIMKLAVTLGADTYALMLLIIAGRARKSLDPSPKQKYASVRAMCDEYLRLRDRIKFAYNTTIPVALLPNYLLDADNRPPFGLCSFPYTLAIDANGNTAPCDGFLNIAECITGNVRRDSLQQIWRKSRIVKKTLSIEAENLKGVCRICKHKYYCRGGCRASAYIVYNDWRGPDPACQELYDAGILSKGSFAG